MLLQLQGVHGRRPRFQIFLRLRFVAVCHSLGYGIAVALAPPHAHAETAPAAQLPAQQTGPAAADAPVPEVLVQGSRQDLVRGPRDATAASSVIRRDELLTPGATSADVLARVPGVTVLRAGSAAEFATASIRGAESRQIPVYLAGIRINDDVDGSTDLSTLPLWMVQHIEVYRGNSPAAADRSGLAGAIFFEPLHPTGPALGAGIGVGSFGARDGWLSAAVGNSRASTLVAARASTAKNDYLYTNDHGQRFQLAETRERRINADYSEADLWTISDYKFGDSARFSLLLNALDREQGAPSIAVTPTHSARTHLRRLLGGASGYFRCDAADRCHLTLGVTATESGTTTRDPRRELRTSSGTWAHRQGERFQQSAHLDLRPLDVVKLSASLEHAQETLRHRFEQHVPQNAGRNELNLAVNSLFFPESRVSPQLLLRAHCAATHGSYIELSQLKTRSNQTCTLAPPDARLGLRVAALPNVSLLANAARVTLPPTLGELYGINPSVTGNPDLVPEESLNLDVGAEVTQAVSRDLRFSLNAFAFARWASNLIRYQRTSLNAMSPFNEAKARILGVEGELSATLFHSFTSKTTFTALDPRRVDNNVNTNDILSLSPRLTWFEELGVATALPEFGIQRAALCLLYTHTSSRYMDRAGFVVLPAQSRLDTTLTISLTSPLIHLRLAAINLINNESQDILGLPLPGRSFHASLEAWWK